MTARKNFLLVEDETLVRDGVRAMLEKEAFVDQIFEAGNKKEFIEAIKNQNVDLVLLDFRLRDCNGLELLGLLRRKERGIKVIVVTGLDGTEIILNLLKVGVDGIVYKLDGYQEIRRAIEKVLGGKSCFSEKVMVLLHQNAHKWELLAPVSLTFVEKELLAAISKGLTTKEIAVHLRMPETTTETYRQRLMRKMNVSNTAGLLAFAYRNGLL